MGSVFLFLASGDSLYVGAALLLLAIAASRHSAPPWLLLLLRIISWFALAMMVMAAPPFAWLVDGIFLAAFGAWVLTSGQTVPLKQAKLHFAATVVLIALLTVLPAMEFSHRSMPIVAGERQDHITVIGDSISYGIGSKVTWPSVMQETIGVSVNNLALPGATTADGIAMARKVGPEDRIVLVEIGGNDLLGGTPSNVFGDNLDAILSQVCKPGRTVVMFELPLLPHKIVFGHIQRRLSKKYGVYLIPKHFFTDVLGGPNATIDGLHLSDVGANRMADLVARALSPVLRTKPSGEHTARWQ
ncbi:MAG TPA: GDSL-type esterase/lipase family protein [Verrucomicrobiae bacterium]|nr:GDSL-type esterase/lipase family protein [Verrucomicrobiae bacterium]